jgi:hypothetical protein
VGCCQFFNKYQKTYYAGKSLNNKEHQTIGGAQARIFFVGMSAVSTTPESLRDRNPTLFRYGKKGKCEDGLKRMLL